MKALKLIVVAMMAMVLASCADILENVRGTATHISFDLSEVLKTSSARGAVSDDAIVTALLINAKADFLPTTSHPTQTILKSTDEALFLALQGANVSSFEGDDKKALIASIDKKNISGSKITFDNLPIGESVVCAVLVQKEIAKIDNVTGATPTKIPIYEYSYGKTNAITLNPGANAATLSMPVMETIFVVGDDGNGSGNGTQALPVAIGTLLKYCDTLKLKRVRLIANGDVTHYNGLRTDEFFENCTYLALANGTFKFGRIRVTSNVQLELRNTSIITPDNTEGTIAVQDNASLTPIVFYGGTGNPYAAEIEVVSAGTTVNYNYFTQAGGHKLVENKSGKPLADAFKLSDSMNDYNLNNDGYLGRIGLTINPALPKTGLTYLTAPKTCSIKVTYKDGGTETATATKPLILSDKNKFQEFVDNGTRKYKIPVQLTDIAKGTALVFDWLLDGTPVSAGYDTTIIVNEDVFTGASTISLDYNNGLTGGEKVSRWSKGSSPNELTCTVNNSILHFDTSDNDLALFQYKNTSGTEIDLTEGIYKHVTDLGSHNGGLGSSAIFPKDATSALPSKTIKKIILPKALKKLDANAFKGMTALETVNFDPRYAGEIKGEMFEGCDSLQKVVVWNDSSENFPSYDVRYFSDTNSNLYERIKDASGEYTNECRLVLCSNRKVSTVWIKTTDGNGKSCIKNQKLVGVNENALYKHTVNKIKIDAPDINSFGAGAFLRKDDSVECNIYLKIDKPFKFADKTFADGTDASNIVLSIVTSKANVIDEWRKLNLYVYEFTLGSNKSLTIRIVNDFSQ